MNITYAQAHTVLDLQTQIVLAGELVLYGNKENTAYSAGSSPYVKQRVIFEESKQIELGNGTRSKKTGMIVFEIHCRSNTGSATRNALLQKIDDGFRAKSIGGVILLGVQSIGESGALNWSISSHLIEFYFYSI